MKITTENYIEKQEQLTRAFMVDAIKVRLNDLIHDNLIMAGEIERLLKLEIENEDKTDK